MDRLRAKRLLSVRLSGGGLLQWVLALAVSLMLWIAAIADREFSVVHRLEVAPPDVPDGLMVLLARGSDSSEVTFTGRGISILWDQATGCPARIRLPYVPPPQPVEYPYVVSTALAGGELEFTGRTYRTLEAASYAPPSVSLTIDREVTRRIPVKVMSPGGIPGRYYWQSASLDSVSVTGAASLVMRIDSCRTEAVSPEVGIQTAALPTAPGVERCDPQEVSAALVAPVPVVAFSAPPSGGFPY